MKKIKVFIDGGARGNPGPAACGVVVYDENGKIIKKVGELLGSETNNQAEYHGLIAGLILVKDLGAENVEIFSDSELLVKQMRGEYKVKDAHLKPLALVARFLIKTFKRVTFFAIPREKNKAADKLVNSTLDGKKPQKPLF